jgi:hypothetical protein
MSMTMSIQDEPDDDTLVADDDEMMRALRAVVSAMDQGDIHALAAALSHPVWGPPGSDGRPKQN